MIAEMGTEVIDVEEESVPGLDGNDEADGYDYTATGDITDNVNWGADGFGELTKVNVGGTDYTLTGPSITVYFDADGLSQGTTAAGAAAIGAHGRAHSAATSMKGASDAPRP